MKLIIAWSPKGRAKAPALSLHCIAATQVTDFICQYREKVIQEGLQKCSIIRNCNTTSFKDSSLRNKFVANIFSEHKATSINEFIGWV